jgi:hypothetical protein
LIIAALTALSSCSFVAKVTGDKKPDVAGPGGDDLPDGAGDVAGASDRAEDEIVPEDAGPPPASAHNAMNKLDELEQKAASGQFQVWGWHTEEMGQILFYSENEELTGWGGLPALQARYRKLITRTAAAVDGLATEIVDDGTPPAKPDSGDIDKMKRVLEACEGAAKVGFTTPDAVKKKIADEWESYGRRFVSARKKRPAALRFYAPRLIECEGNVAALRGYADDKYVRREATAETYTDCGVVFFEARAPQLGSGRWGKFERAPGSISYPEQRSCKKIKRKNKYAAKYKQAVREFKEYGQNVKGWFRTTGKSRVDRDSDNFIVYKYVAFEFHSPKLSFSGNPCGGKTNQIWCEEGGSRVSFAVNAARFYRAKAEAHKKAGRTARCKDALKNLQQHVASAANENSSIDKAARQKVKFKLADDKKPIAPAALKKVIADLVVRVEGMVDDDFCE